MLFNHESLVDQAPVIIRQNGEVDVLPIKEVVPIREDGPRYQSVELHKDLEIWDGDRFVRVLGGSAYKHRPVVDNKGVRRLEARRHWHPRGSCSTGPASRRCHSARHRRAYFARYQRAYFDQRRQAFRRSCLCADSPRPRAGPGGPSWMGIRGSLRCSLADHRKQGPER